MGYCPQFDSLFEYLTVQQTLNLFASLKGVRGKDAENAVTTLMKTLLLDQYKDKLMKDLRYCFTQLGLGFLNFLVLESVTSHFRTWG